MNSWKVSDIPQDQIDQMVQRYQIPPLAARILVHRGIIQSEDLRFWLDRDLKSCHSPFLFEDMETVVERLQSAVEDREKVLVFGDRDVDGITSAALMVEAFRSKDLVVQWRLPMEDESYGLGQEVVRQAALEGVTLLVTVDCGITNLDEIDLACELGIDVIVIDHHNPLDELPAALGIIDPKTEDSAYPFDGLCAAALCSKVLLAWDCLDAPWYGQEYCLLNLKPGNGFMVFEALRIRNLVQTARLCENLADTSNPQVFGRILPFIQGYPLVVHDRELQLKFMKQIFGSGSDIYLEGLDERLGTHFPELRGRSLLRLRQGSRLARFSTQVPEEIEVLKHLFVALCHAEHPGALETWRGRLGLVALSTVADMAPLLDENRLLVRSGLEVLPRIENPGLIALMRELKILAPSISVKDIGWRLSPALNSSGRMGRPDVAMNLLLSKDVQLIPGLVRELVQLNDQRRLQGEQSWDLIRRDLAASLETHGGKLILAQHPDIPRGVTGILAARISREFQVPALLVTTLGDRCVGSIRSLRGLKVTDLLGRFDDLFSNWGGHDAAGGFSFEAGRMAEFQARLGEYSGLLELEARGSLDDSGPDVEVPADLMTEELWKIEELLAPAGQEFPLVLYLCRDCRITDIQLVGKGRQHVKLGLKTGNRVWPGILWNQAQRIPGDFAQGDLVDITFHLEKNLWGANETLQLAVQDIRRSRPGPV